MTAPADARNRCLELVHRLDQLKANQVPLAGLLPAFYSLGDVLAATVEIERRSSEPSIALLRAEEHLLHFQYNLERLQVAPLGLSESEVDTRLQRALRDAFAVLEALEDGRDQGA